jgi:predicted dinucleotide-binding enzyme
MNIGIIGTGNVAQLLGAKLIEAGHSVVHGTRDVETTLARSEPDGMGNPPFSKWLEGHPKAQLKTFAEAAAHAELVINATGGMVSLAALKLAGHDNLADKILIDVANPLDFSKGFPPTLSVCNDDSLGEEIQRAIPKAKVVKTLNTMSAYVMVNPGLVPGNHNIFLCGDDEDAKGQVKTLLVEALGWTSDAMIDLGDISNARGTEMLLPIWVRLFGTLQNPIINFHIAQGTPPK